MQWVSERLWVLIVAGIPTGVLVAGVGSRMAMMVLRLTSPDSVVGVTSDDGFEIGRFTLGGTYNLLMLGASIGVIGAGGVPRGRTLAAGPHLVPSTHRRGRVGGSRGIDADPRGRDRLPGLEANVWLMIALLGLVALVGDVRALT